jgi:hypothetical protein
MINVDMIQKAIAAHARWKVRLRSAVDTGKFDVTPATVKADNQCEFGKWLYGSEFSDDEKQTANYRTAVDLHAKFHLEAAKVVEWAASGHEDTAETLMGPEGSYTKASTALMQELVRWRLRLTSHAERHGHRPETKGFPAMK